MNGARRSLLVARRELDIEAASRDLAVTVAPFVAATLLLAGLAFGPAPDRLAATAPGVVWLAVLFAAASMAGHVAAAEEADGCWDLLRAMVTPAGLLAGKLAALWLWLAATWAGAAMLAVVLFDAAMPAAGVAAGLLGTLGVAAVTVVLGVVVRGQRRRAGMLAVLLLPAGLPALLAGVAAATPGTPGPVRWLALLVAYDALAVALAWAVFPALLEE